MKIVLYFVLSISPILASQNFRLQRDVLPTSYSLKLAPDFEGTTFKGEVTIMVRNDRPITNLTLNSKMLTIDEITLDQAYGTTKYIMDPPNEILHVFYGDAEIIDPGEHILHIKFTGTFKENYYYGFYKLEHQDNYSRDLFATKFSPNHAREAFPCFDEPYFKSIFNVRILKPNNSWEAISNMREIGRFETSNGIAVDFESTVPMSTYLLAWVITDYNYEELEIISGGRKIPLRFFASGNNSEELKEVLTVTKKAMEFFINYTEVAYPLPKLDSIAIPGYRSRGMEHFGLVVYQDQAIFKSNPFTSKLYYSIGVDLLIGHEISHMWFGNLVTHEWYNDLWLTEGFARFMQYKAGVAIFGESFVKYMFQEKTYLSLFKFRCFNEVATVSYPRRLNQIWKQYGTSTYDQGGAVLLMLEDLIGEEKFRKVVKKYLESHSYSYATTGDFINEMDEVEPKYKIRGVMESFLFQDGLPLVNVSLENDQFVLKQFALCGNNESSIFGHRWSFPVRYITSGNLTSNIIWFDREMKEVKIPKKKNDEWIQINHNSNGLYRAFYPREIYLSIGANLQKLQEQDVGPFIEEAFFMNLQKRIQCDVPLKLMGALKTIKNIGFLTFTYASRSFSLFIRDFVYERSIEKILHAYFFDIFGDLYEKVTWKVQHGETLDARLLRTVVLESFCLGSQKYKKCSPDVELLRASNESVHKDVEYIYRAVLRESKKLNTTMSKEAMEQSEKNIEVDSTCSSWIKKNIPKLIIP